MKALSIRQPWAWLLAISGWLTVLVLVVGTLEYTVEIEYENERLQAQAEVRAKVVRECPYYVVVSRDRRLDCRRLMPVMELHHPLRQAHTEKNRMK